MKPREPIRSLTVKSEGRLGMSEDPGIPLQTESRKTELIPEQ